jgi:hypothetical protein
MLFALRPLAKVTAVTLSLRSIASVVLMRCHFGKGLSRLGQELEVG